MNPRSRKSAVITMIRAVEFPAAWSSLRTVEPQLGPNVHRFLLLNDSRNPELENTLLDRPHTDVLTPGENLGVAIGRNALIREALRWGADTIFSLDDDLLVPSDYIGRVTAWIDRRLANGEKIGVVAPAVLDFHAVADETMTDPEIEDAESGNLDQFLDTDQLRSRVQGAWTEDLPVEVLYHTGIREWRYNYLESYQGRAATLRDLYLAARGIAHAQPDVAELRLDLDTRRAVLLGDGDGTPIDTAAGGACVYTSELVQTIGGIDEAFSPFGYEDSDFAIRALEAGFNNYALTSEILLHDLDSRLKSRSPAITLYNQARARALIGRKHLPRSERIRGLAEIGFLAPIQATEIARSAKIRYRTPLGGALGALTAYIAGFSEGLFTQPHEPDFSGGESMRQYDVPPHHAYRQFTVELDTWQGTPLAGLPRTLSANVTISYSWDVASGTMNLHNLSIDCPGLIRLKMNAKVLGVGSRAPDGGSDPLGCRLAGASIEVEDWGFLRRFQTTVAWFREERSAGYLSSLIRPTASRFSQAARDFLAIRDEPVKLTLKVDPATPMSVRELFDFPHGTRLRDRAGLSIVVANMVRY